MLQINLMIFFFFFLIILIDGMDEDLFDDLWKNLKPSTSENFKKQKFGETNAIKEETVDIHEIYKQQNDSKIIIKSENCSENEMEDKKPKLLQRNIKEKTLEKQNNKLKIKIKMPKIEDQMSEESFENELIEQADQNVSSAVQSNSADDEDYNDMEFKKINEIYMLNKFNLMKKELRKETVYKNLTNTQFENEIAKKLGPNRTEIYKLKKKLGQKREKRTEESEETKMELIRKFDQMSKENICGLKYDKKKRNKSEIEIANELGTNRNKIYKWKKEFGIIKSFTKQQQIEKIKQFEKMKEEISKKFNLKAKRKIKYKIVEKIGVGLSTIYGWKREFGFSIQRKCYSDAEKLEFVKRSEEMRKRNPMINDGRRNSAPNRFISFSQTQFSSEQPCFIDTSDATDLRCYNLLHTNEVYAVMLCDSNADIPPARIIVYPKTEKKN